MVGLNACITAATASIEDPVNRIAMALSAFLGYFDEHPEVVELLIQERAEFRDRENPTFRLHREKNIGPWHTLLEELMAAGRVRTMPADIITGVISDTLYGKIFTTYFGGKRRTFQSQVNEVLTVIFAGILSDDERGKLSDYLLESQE